MSTTKLNTQVMTTDPVTLVLPAGQTEAGLTITDARWTVGNPYKIDLCASNGQVVASYVATAPS